MLARMNFFSLVTLLILLFLTSNAVYIVDQKQQALIFQFGEVVDVVKKPGLNMRFPFIQTAYYLDNRILNVITDEKEVIAKDQKRLIVSAFVKYKIHDPLKFYQTVRDEVGIRSRLSAILDSSLRQVLGEYPLISLLSNERSKIMKKIQQIVATQTVNFGIEIIDVRILHADLPRENSDAIYKRMQTERSKEAKEFRAEGLEEAQRIKATADKEKKLIIAEAQKNAQILKGEGEAKASKIFADAYNQDPSFFAFYRSLQAYKKSLNKEDTTIILSPDSDFLKFLNAN